VRSAPRQPHSPRRLTTSSWHSTRWRRSRGTWIAAITLTGSTKVGAIVAAQAGAALKKQVLELGGSDPFIVLADADVPAAAATAVKARFINIGQGCVNAKRFLVDEAVADEFVAAFTAGAAALAVGDPAERRTAIGPMARADLREALREWRPPMRKRSGRWPR
jgi:succinate-semialdehyde dehydrogenase/glutarate-semialdehyde dehydrogenase